MDKNYEKLIDKDKYQVFLFKSMATFPFIFAIHPWFVLNKMGEISRWEIAWSTKYLSEMKWGHLYKNRLPLFLGCESFSFSNNIFNAGYLVGRVEGDMALSIINFISQSPANYNYCNQYNLLGPNSNTYVQWVINNFPQSNLKLPFNAIGKNFKINEKN